MKKTDVIVIGAGMAGVTAAIYLSRANANFILIEKDSVGGKLKELHKIENFPTIEETTGKEIIDGLLQQLEYQHVNVEKGNVQTILKDVEGFNVVTDQESYIAKKVIVATGNVTQEKTIKGEQEFYGRGVSYCAVCDGNFFKGQTVAVIGNNNIAIEESIYLAGIAKTVILVTPSEIHGDFELINKAKTLQNLNILENSVVEEIVGNEFAVNGIVVNGETIPVAGVFPYVGEKTSTQILKNLKPAMNGNYVIVDQNMMSNIEGLYFAGDIVDKKLRQLITASSDGAIAAVSALK